MNKTYAYVRVSSTTQNVDRQMQEMYKLEIPKKNIYIDMQSGKDFNRPNYIRLKKKLKENDLLIIKSIDRLGRNYEMIIQEWTDITKNIKADIYVIDFPLLDTRNDASNLVGKFISDIVLQVLSFVAQNERENIRQRQAEGIRIAKEKGIHMGRPKYKIPKNFQTINSQFLSKKIDINEAITKTKMKKSTFYKYSKIYR